MLGTYRKSLDVVPENIQFAIPAEMRFAKRECDIKALDDPVAET